MKAGTYQTDSLPPYCDWRRSLGLSDAAEPGAGDGKVNVDRPHSSTPIPAAALSGGDRQQELILPNDA